MCTNILPNIVLFLRRGGAPQGGALSGNLPNNEIKEREVLYNRSPGGEKSRVRKALEKGNLA